MHERLLVRHNTQKNGRKQTDRDRGMRVMEEDTARG